jgi:hypothetical protein
MGCRLEDRTTQQSEIFLDFSSWKTHLKTYYCHPKVKKKQIHESSTWFRGEGNMRQKLIQRFMFKCLLVLGKN